MENTLHNMIEERWMYLDLLAEENMGNADFLDCPETDAIYENMEADELIRERYPVFIF